jgi:two-component system sensor kinase FixL
MGKADPNRTDFAPTSDANVHLPPTLEPPPQPLQPPANSTPPAGPIDPVDERARSITEETLREKERRLEQALEAAQQSSHRYQELFDFAPDGYVVTDSYGVIEEANQAAAYLLGARKAFLAGKPLAFFMTGATPEFYGHLSRLLREGGPTSYWEMTLHRRNGETVCVAVSVSVAVREGAPSAFRWLLRDISARVRAERGYLAEKSFGDRLMEAAQAIILVVDAQGRIRRSNLYLQAVSGYTERELQGNDWSALLLSTNEQLSGRQIIERAGGLSISASPAKLVAKDGTQRSISWSAKILGGDRGEVLILGHDLTEREEAQRKALRAERLAAIGQMVAGLAHESRNALQRIQACVAMLRQECADKSRALELLDRVQKAQDDLHRLHDDVREYASPIHLDRYLCSLAELWREPWDSLSPYYAGRDVSLSEETQAVDLVCDVDRFRFVQVFRNVFENALAACPDPVRIVVGCAGAELGERQALRIVVRDNGPGLTPEQKRRAFEPFYTTKNRGSGLGLCICRRVVEAHGGTIALGDGPGGEVVITLPRRQS